MAGLNECVLWALTNQKSSLNEAQSQDDLWNLWNLTFFPINHNLISLLS